MIQEPWALKEKDPDRMCGILNTIVEQIKKYLDFIKPSFTNFNKKSFKYN